MNYYIADTHFGHSAILRFDHRPFSTIEEMEEVMVLNWNATVKADDTIHILGDFCWGKASDWLRILRRLNGHKVLIEGNHYCSNLLPEHFTNPFKWRICLMWGDEKYYLQKVDSTLEKVRSYCLGQNTRLLAILPNHFLTHTSKQQFRQIAKQILFALAKTMSEDISTEDLNRSSAWLQTVTQYLLEECNDTDETFRELKRLIFLPQHIRQIVFCDVSGLVGKEIRENEPPGLLKELDGSIWWLLKVQSLECSAESMYKEIVLLLSSRIPK